MAKGSAGLISEFLLEILACPLSKKSLRLCQNSRSLVSDAIGVSFPIVDGIPCLIPKDGKLLEDQDQAKCDTIGGPSSAKTAS